MTDRQKPRPSDGAFKVAGATGIEPATSDVTGRRSNQLNYAPSNDFRFNPTNNFKAIKLPFIKLYWSIRISEEER